MFVKFKKYVDEDNPPRNREVGDVNVGRVCPAENHIFEVKDVKYRKYRVLNVHEYQDILVGYDNLHILFSFLSWYDSPENEEKKVPKDGVEFIVATIKDMTGETVSISAPNSHMFIMNDNGKTIDKEHCIIYG